MDPPTRQVPEGGVPLNCSIALLASWFGAGLMYFCSQVCDRTLQPCGHRCPAPCHDQVKVKVAEAKKAATPWEAVGPRIETRAVECPDCQAPVPVTCLGAHETADWPCHAAKAGPCGRPCGRSHR